jgi:dienelactone hydrolase
MSKSKTAYIIPGHLESPLRQRGYKKIGKLFEAKGIDPVYIEINWRKENPSRFKTHLEDFFQQYRRKDGEVYLLGFSYGAVIAFLAAKKVKPKALILCSISPYFKEDLTVLRPAWRKWWEENYIESDYSFDAIASSINCQTYLLLGSKEPKEVFVRVYVAEKLLQKSKVIQIQGAGHKIGQSEYIETLMELIGSL